MSIMKISDENIYYFKTPKIITDTICWFIICLIELVVKQKNINN